MTERTTAEELFARPRIEVEERADGTTLLRSKVALADPDPNVGTWLRRGADDHPDRVLVAERDGDGWREATWGHAWEAARAVGQAALDRGLSEERPVVILSGNGVDHLLLTLGCLLVGVPVVPVSPAYSLQATRYDKLVRIVEEVTPGLVFVDRGAPFAAALDALDLDGVELVAATEGPPGSTALAEVGSTRPTDDVDAAASMVGASTLAKVLYTSGSTGVPKGVRNTHGMLTANQRQLQQIWPFLADHAPVLLDWLPWNHTFGGNHDVGLVLANAGSIYVDDGRPAPGMIERTVRNLHDVQPTISFNVPAGYGALVGHLEADDEVAAAFFSRLRIIFYAAAALPQDLWSRLERLAERHSRDGVVMTSSWGATETAPLATSAHFPLERAGNIGVPVPGVELELVPVDGTHEVRVRGPNVTPGYHRRPERTAEAFDDEGFYRVGDAVRFADPGDPCAGLLFDGRVAEDFKLLTGTKVPAGQLRLDVIDATSPLVADAVVTGHDRDRIGVLVWLRADAAADLSGADPADAASLAEAPEVRDALRAGLQAHNAEAGGSSRTVRRASVLVEPPSFDAGEITDKGYVNQRAVLERRAELVERLHADDPEDDVIVL